MSRIRAVKGVLKILWQNAAEDFEQMDHKLLRIGIGAAAFIFWGLFWLYFLQSTSPFGF